MKKRICYILLTLCMVLVVLPMTVFAVEDGSIFASGTGSETDAYTIATLAQLEAFRDSVNIDGESYAGKFIKLTADIDMSKTYGAGKGKDGTYASWTPIGVFKGVNSGVDNPGAKPFKGTFDGNGHVIDVYINTTADNQGLFAYVGAGGTVKNLGIDGEITGFCYVGGVTAFNCGTIEDCYNAATVSGDYSHVGGITGCSVEGTTKNCNNTGTVSGSVCVGGVVGWSVEGNVENCYNTGEVRGNGAGGVVGCTEYGTVTNCYNTGTVSGTDKVGGVVGTLDTGIVPKDAGTVTNCYNTGTVSGGNAGGVVGDMRTGTVENCYYLDTSCATGIGSGTDTTVALTSADFTNADKFSGFDFDDTWVMNTFLGRPTLKANPEITIVGDGTSDDPFEIPNLTTLEAFRNAVNTCNDFSDQFIKLTADIDMSKTYGAGKGKDGTYASWTPIGVFTGRMNGTDNPGAKPFKGTFDGNGHVIDVYINNPTADNQGLFAYVAEGGTVKNLGIVGEITGKDYVGGVTVRNYGTIEDCYNAATVSGDYYVGGVVGYMNGAVVENCYNTGKVSGGSIVGGVVGNIARGVVENCYNTGKVSGDTNVGGVVGYFDDGTVTNCYNTGTVSGTGDVVGGVVGYVKYGTVTNCYYLKSSQPGIGYGTDTTVALTSAEFKDASKFTGFDFTNTWEMNTFLGRPMLKANPETTIVGDGESPETAFEISNLTELEAFRNAVNTCNDFSGQFIKLTADIDMSKTYGAGKGKDGTYASWTPIGVFTGRMGDKDNDGAKPFKGTFDGNGHVIDVYINNPTADNQGLFAYVGAGGTVKNLGIAGEITGGKWVGGVTAHNYGPIENCYNAATVRGGSQVGGVVGYMNGAVVENCYNTGAVSGTGSGGSIGGVVGCMDNGVAIENCYNTGTVSGTGDVVGGVVGYVKYGTVTNCYYLDTSCATGIGSGTDTTTAKTADEFASGEVAYLLQGTQTEQIWGQTLGTDISPVFANETGSNKVYTVTFVVNDDSTVAYANGGEITIAAPVLDGYAFAGWYTAQTGGERVTTIDADNTTLYAQFTPNARTITFDPNGGTVDKTTATTDANGKLTNIPTPTRKNHNFLGWFTEDGKMVTTDTIFTEPTTVYAHWQIMSSSFLPTWEGWELIDKIVEANKKKDEPVEVEPEPEETEPVEEVEPAWENPFSDISESDAFYDAIKFVYENGYMNGMSENTFAPNEGLTRAMLVTVLYRAAGAPVMDEANPFVDVANDAWYYNAVVWARSIGLINGITETEFAPDDELTREQLVTIFYRYAEFLGYDLSIGEDTNILSYEDFADIAEYAIPAMQWACGANLIENIDGNILPKDNATRALVAMVLYGFYA